MYVYSAAMLSLAIVLTVLGAGATWLAWRHGGFSSALFWLGMTLLPTALYLTGLLRIVAIVLDQFSAFLVGFVFSPTVWAGVIVAVVALACFAAARLTKGRGKPVSATKSRPEVTGQRERARGKGRPAIDEDLAEIEDLLRKRGIS